MKMHAVEEELPVPKALTAAPSELYSPEDAPETLTAKHPLGADVLELQETPRAAKERMRARTWDAILANSN
jgi:hypothetical protein